MNKVIAQKIAKQLVQEPLEILKTAKEQVVENQSEESGIREEPKAPDFQSKLQDKIKSSRRMEAFQRELADIRKGELFKDLQRRIAQGEEISLQDYPELSLEQKQVLKAQMEAVKAQMLNAKNSNDKLLQEPAAKKGRRLFNFGKKQEVKRQQTRVENVVPPSG